MNWQQHGKGRGVRAKMRVLREYKLTFSVSDWAQYNDEVFRQIDYVAQRVRYEAIRELKNLGTITDEVEVEIQKL